MDCHDDGTGTVVTRGLRQIALLGSPNVGKTTLFNALSGLRAKTANYPGVTVTRRESEVSFDGVSIRLVDLPGTYSLTPISPDEQVVADALQGDIPGFDAPDGLAVVVDATSLERSLLLVGQVLRLGIPSLVILTMVDEVAARGGVVDVARLSRALGVPVVAVVGHRGIGLDHLREQLVRPESWERPVLSPPADSAGRSAWVSSIVASSVKPLQADQRTRRIDAVLLHPVAGALVFLTVMLAFFQAIFTLAAPLQGWVESFFGWLGRGATNLLPGIVGRFVAEGIIGGVGGVLVFLPQILLLFLILALLEKVGYLAACGVPRRSGDGPIRHGGSQFCFDPLVICIRGARHHVDANDSV